MTDKSLVECEARHWIKTVRELAASEKDRKAEWMRLRARLIEKRGRGPWLQELEAEMKRQASEV